jgi:hypothetical protein
MVSIPTTLNRGLERGWGSFESTTLSYPVSLNRGLERGYGAYEPVGMAYETTLNRGLERGYITELEGPFLLYPSPVGTVCVVVASQLSFTLGAVLPRTVNLATLVVSIEYLLSHTPSPVTVYDGGAGGFQAGFTGSITDVSTTYENLQEFVVTPDAGWAELEIVRVTVDVDDDLGAPMFPTETWDFCTLEDIILYTVAADPASDTFRGGAELVITSSGTLQDTSEDETFLGHRTLPTPWTDVSTGSGAASIDFKRGLTLATGGAPGAVAAVRSATLLDHFDISVDMFTLGPQTARSEITEAALELICGAGELVVKVLRRPAGVVATSYYTVNGFTTPGGTVPLTSRSFTLRLVRNGARVWAFVDDTQLHSDGYFFAAGVTGTARIWVANNLTNSNVRCRVTNYKIESHARIGNRLLDNKTIIFRRLVGNVPAATLEEVGDAELAAFGLFGEAVDPTGFEYTLPTPRTVGRARNRLFELYSDEQQRDGD